MGKLCRFTNLSNQEFGLWEVTDVFVKRGKHICWECRCVCGRVQFVYASNLTGGKSQGCHVCTAKRHGKSRTPEHDAWKNMLARCLRKNHPEYHNYGERGITVCSHWRVFENFYADMGDRPSNEHSLGRKDNDAGYDIDNCRWETPEQQHNNKRTNVLATLHGDTMTLTQWSRILKVPFYRVREHLVTLGSDVNVGEPK